MGSEEYTWLRYYEDLYHRQKKTNNLLAMQIGESCAKHEELEFALNRVTGSKFWKALAPARKLYSALKGSGTAADAKTGSSGDSMQQTVENGALATAGTEAADSAYRLRLEQYEDYYGRWIEKDELENRYKDYSGDTGRARIRKKLYRTVLIEDCRNSASPAEGCENGQWLLFVSKDGKLAEGYAERISIALESRPEAIIAYADEDFRYSCVPGEGSLGTDHRRVEPNFKPDWSPDTLDSFFYFGNIALIRAELASKLNWLGSHDAWANVYDFFLQASEYVGRHFDDPGVLHIPQVLFHRNADAYLPNDTDDKMDRYQVWKHVSDRLKEDLALGKLCVGYSREYDHIKLRAFARRGISADFHNGQDPAVRQIQFSPDKKPLISVLIPTKDHPEVLRNCLSSFTERTEYDNLEFIVVDNGSSEANRQLYEKIIEESAAGFRHEYIYEPMEFNFSTMCNLAAGRAAGDMLLFLNDDIEIVQKDWLGLMAGYAGLEHVGAVGAKLIYAGTDKIQHAGVTSLTIGPSHKLVMYPDDRWYYYGRNELAYDMLGVTGACLLIAKDKFNSVKGFDEGFAVAYNDVDLCMKLSKSGLVNLQCNGALLYHYESMTRGQDEGNDDKWDRLLHEKDRLYSRHPEFYKKDPYYNPNLISNHSFYYSNYDFGYNMHLKRASVRQLDESRLAKMQNDTFKVSIDFAGTQQKENLDEPRMTEIRGWCFLSGGDNSDLTVDVVLREKSTGKCLISDTDPVPREDLERTFPDEINNRLCGFECRMLSEDLPSGTYDIGVAPKRLKDDLTQSGDPVEVIFTGASTVISPEA